MLGMPNILSLATLLVVSFKHSRATVLDEKLAACFENIVLEPVVFELHMCDVSRLFL